MVEDLKNHESGQENENPMATLADEKSFAEHMKDIEKESSIGEKYYQQAEAEKARWIEDARSSLAFAERLEPEDVKLLINPDYWNWRADSGPKYRVLDRESADDMAKFNQHKTRKIEEAKKQIEKEKGADLDQLAKSFRNLEYIAKIATKLESDEDFSDDELEFLGDAPDSLDDDFPTYNFETPEIVWHLNHDFIWIPTYEGLLDPKDEESAIREYPQWAIIARAQMRQMMKEDKSLLHNSEEIQAALDSMEERRTANPFAGETNLNSATGEARTFTPEDNYPRREDESEEDYAKRLKRIQLKSRQAEMRR